MEEVKTSSALREVANTIKTTIKGYWGMGGKLIAAAIDLPDALKGNLVVAKV